MEAEYLHRHRAIPNPFLMIKKPLPELRGANKLFFDSTEREIINSGPAGTGKSRAALEKLHYYAQRYPKCRLLMTRQTRESMTESCLVTFERDVLGENVTMGEASRKSRKSYDYPNGSTIVVAGLTQNRKDNKSNVMSTEYDMIYVQEATEVTEEVWEKLSTRLRSYVLPFQQILGDCNPDHERHWLKVRGEEGRGRMVYSLHTDNPMLYRAGGWTREGHDYIDRLKQLTGVMYERLFLGKWCHAEGAVYEINHNVHIIDPFKIPDSWRRIRGIDFGYTNPFVCHWYAIDPDGRLYLYREIYKTRTLCEDHAKRIVALTGKERIDITLADHDAEDAATLYRHGVKTYPAKKVIKRGIELVQSRIKIQGDGKPRLYIFRNALVDRDETLVFEKQPFCTVQEFDAYIYPKGIDGKVNKETPIDNYNHGMDALRYVVTHLDDRPGMSRADIEKHIP